MSDHLVRWNTGRLLSKNLDKLNFMKNYKGIHPEIYSLYEEVIEYKENNYSENIRSYSNKFGFDQEIFDTWISHLDKLIVLQKLIHSNKDPEEIGNLTLEIFDNEDVSSVKFVDLEMLEKLEILLNYSESIRNLFNFIVPLLVKNETIPYELEQEIREILNQKGLGTYKIPNLSNINKSIQLT